MQVNSYIYGESFYHRFDIRAKLLFTILFVISVFFIESPLKMAAAASIPLAIALFSIGAKETWRDIRRLIPLMIMLVLFMPFQKRSGTPLLLVRGFALVTEEALLYVSGIGLRLLAISLISMLLVQTEEPETIILGMRFYRLPYSAALVFSIILRFIPFLASQFESIRSSMSLRLSEDKRGVPIMPVVTSLVVSAIKMIPETASALEERGFGRGKRTEFKTLCPIGQCFTHFMLSVIVPIIFFVFLR